VKPEQTVRFSLSVDAFSVSGVGVKVGAACVPPVWM